MLHIRPAQEAELEEIWVLARRAVRHMNAGGNPQWGEDYPTRALYAGDIAAGELYAAGEHGRILGVACINTRQSPEYEAVDWALPGPALTVHRLAVDPDAQGRGVGRALLDFAVAQARTRGLRAFHIDTYTQNEKMQHLILSRGFRRVGEIRLHGRPLPYPCFEKLLEET